MILKLKLQFFGMLLLTWKYTYLDSIYLKLILKLKEKEIQSVRTKMQELNEKWIQILQEKDTMMKVRFCEYFECRII